MALKTGVMMLKKLIYS